MRKLLLFLFSALLITGPALAQTSDCGNGVPCGPIPWRLPILPALPSPSPMPTLAVTTSSINPGAPTSTLAPISTPTPISLYTGGIDVQINAISTLIAQTPVALTGSSGLGLSTNLLTNGSFFTWSGSPSIPSGWIVQNENGTTRNISQVGSGQGAGGTGLGSTNYFQSDSSSGLILAQSGKMTIGQPYRAQITISFNSSTGTLLLGDSAGAAELSIPANAIGIFSVSFTASGTQLTINSTQTTINITIDEVVLQQTSNTTLATMGTDAGTFFGYARGLSGDSFGPLAPLIVLAGTTLVLVVTVKITTFMLPLLAALFGIIRKVVTVILEFLPL